MTDVEAATGQKDFGGGMNLPAFDKALAEHRGNVALVVMTVTNNAVGGQAVSLANLRAVSERCRAAHVPLFLDACRFASNAYRVHCDEASERSKTLAAIAHECRPVRRLHDERQEDAIVNIGGMLGVRDPELPTEDTVDRYPDRGLRDVTAAWPGVT